MIDVSIEAGHIYSPDMYLNSDGSVNNVSVHQGLTLAAQLREGFTTSGLTVKQLLFVDDVDIRTQEELSLRDGWKYVAARTRPIQQIKDHVGMPLFGLSEYDFISPAELLVGKIREKVGISDDLVQTRSGQTVSLVGYSQKYSALPSCTVLDLAAYLEKLTAAEETVTILPSSYRGQQRKVRELAGILEEPLNVSVVFFNRKGQVQSFEQWHNPDSLTDKSQTIAAVVDHLTRYTEL